MLFPQKHECFTQKLSFVTNDILFSQKSVKLWHFLLKKCYSLTLFKQEVQTHWTSCFLEECQNLILFQMNCYSLTLFLKKKCKYLTLTVWKSVIAWHLNFEVVLFIWKYIVCILLKNCKCFVQYCSVLCCVNPVTKICVQVCTDFGTRCMCLVQWSHICDRVWVWCGGLITKTQDVFVPSC